ncbi:hypothetical protein [Burkholderia vietnamiensis]|uniref:hypothetical protein n=1 Tax=Burkholderia vietnamiensis TaxID=60552 RepID=UPI001FC9B928|nr:hypothetical protein [Burkholderia vietnamiensis]
MEQQQMPEGATVARYREEQIRENFGSPSEFLETMEHGDARKLPETQISVKFRYIDPGLLAEHLKARGAGNLASAEKDLEFALLNPTTRPEDAGYRIVESQVSRIGDLTFSLKVRAQVTDARRLAKEAGEEYRRCWGEPDHELSVGEQLYEVLVASNANPAPLDIGLELMSWSNDSLAAQARVEAGRKLQEPRISPEDSIGMTDVEVVEGAERMARVLLKAWGFEFSGEAVRKSGNPRAISAWSVVSAMLEEYNGTDLSSAVDSVDCDVQEVSQPDSVTQRSIPDPLKMLRNALRFNELGKRHESAEAISAAIGMLESK